ncbi:MAG: DUF6089 family protein [Bacteroidales bacterium]|nr:DUF6089 family protein [Bacteroidales bacterium]
MKKYMLLLIMLLVLMPLFLDAQFYEMWRRDRRFLVVGIGAANFLGDLGGANQIGTHTLRDLDWKSTRPLVSMGYRYRGGKYFFLRGNFHFGYLYGDDKFTKEPIRNNRNLNFRSPIIETAGQFEVLLTQIQREGHRYKLKATRFRRVRGWRELNFETYLFSGIAFFWFNPQGRYIDGSWHNLKPLHTEGQGLVETRKPYHRFQIGIPAGIGFRYSLTSDFSIGLEYGMRKTFTDYIDDVSTTYYDNDEIRAHFGDIAAYLADPSLGLIEAQTLPGEQRGDPKYKDAYLFAEITIYYKLRKGGFSVPKF